MAERLVQRFNISGQDSFDGAEDGLQRADSLQCQFARLAVPGDNDMVRLNQDVFFERFVDDLPEDSGADIFKVAR